MFSLLQRRLAKNIVGLTTRTTMPVRSKTPMQLGNPPVRKFARDSKLDGSNLSNKKSSSFHSLGLRHFSLATAVQAPARQAITTRTWDVTKHSRSLSRNSLQIAGQRNFHTALQKNPVKKDEEFKEAFANQSSTPHVLLRFSLPVLMGSIFFLLLAENAKSENKKGMYSDKKSVKILAIDGGGIRGIIPLTILKEIEYRTGERISKLFDVFSGTSTGGIITLGLVKPQPYVTETIFQKKIPGITENDSKEIYQHLLSKKIISGTGDIVQVDFASLKLPQQYEPYKEKIISVLQDPGYYRTEPQFTVDDLIDLYENKGTEIFSSPTFEERSWTELFSMRLMEIIAMPTLIALTDIASQIDETSNVAFVGLIGLGLFGAAYKILQNLCTIVWNIIPPFDFSYLTKGAFAAGMGHLIFGGNYYLNSIGTFALTALNHNLLQDKLHAALWGPRFSKIQLEKLLKQYFGGSKAENTIKPFVISAYDILSNKPRRYYSNSQGALLWALARATSAAPSYFEPIDVYNSEKELERLIDGGVFANNPSEIAHMHAEQELHYEIDYLLSLGTGHYQKDAMKDALSSGALFELDNIIEAIMDNADIEERVRRKFKNNYCRLETPLQSKVDLADASQSNVNALKLAARSYIKAEDKKIDNICRRLMNDEYDSRGVKKFFWEKTNTKENAQPLTLNNLHVTNSAVR